MTTNLDKMRTAALLRLRHHIAHSTEMHRKALGLDARMQLVAAARQQALHGPLYVDQIEIRGRTSRNMYDAHPGYAFYSTDDSVLVDVPPYCGISRAKALAVTAFSAMRETDDASRETHDGDFTPQSIVLRDQFGGALGTYCLGKWDDATDIGATAALLGEAGRLEDAAVEESRWDNFETARSLRAKATLLRERVQCAQSASRAIA